MKSPFPGMDPYLESRWSDVQLTLTVRIQEALQPALPVALRARATERPRREDATEEPTDCFVRIFDVTDGDRLVTAIEVLRLEQKETGRVREEYERRLKAFAADAVSVVEIDLLRSPLNLPYSISVRRRWDGSSEANSIGLRGPLPLIRVPLRRDDPDVLLQLQPLIERVYVSGGHDDIDYSKPPTPPLSGEDAAWAEQFLKEWRPAQR